MKHNPSPNFDDRKQSRVKYLIMHYTGMASGGEAIDRLCDPEASVSAHYVVEENGDLYCLVDEEKRAWHAGVSKWEEDDDINDLSIGIEIVNSGHPYPGYESVYKPFPDTQMNTVVKLATEIVERHNIEPCYVLGHSDVAWRRKIDPGELFDWRMLADKGIGLYPGNIVSSTEDLPDRTKFFENLKLFGYDLAEHNDEQNLLIGAFQRHYRPSKFDGNLDQETFLTLEQLLNKKTSL